MLFRPIPALVSRAAGDALARPEISKPIPPTGSLVQAPRSPPRPQVPPPAPSAASAPPARSVPALSLNTSNWRRHSRSRLPAPTPIHHPPIFFFPAPWDTASAVFPLRHCTSIHPTSRVRPFLFPPPRLQSSLAHPGILLQRQRPHTCVGAQGRHDGRRNGRRANAGVFSRRECRLGLPLVATPGHQRLRRHSRVEVWLRTRLPIWHLHEVGPNRSPRGPGC